MERARKAGRSETLTTVAPNHIGPRRLLFKTKIIYQDK